MSNDFLIIFRISEPRDNEGKRGEPQTKRIKSDAKPQMGEKPAQGVGGKPEVADEDAAESGFEGKSGIATSSDHPRKGTLESSKSDEAPK